MSAQIDEIKKVAERFWEYIENRAANKPKNVEFNVNKKEEFISAYTKQYNEIIDQYMVEGTSSLDSHKSAALFIIQLFKCEIFTCKRNNEEGTTINIYPEIVALDIAFSYMLICLNEKLEVKKIRKNIKEYFFPIPYSCKKKYIEVMYRNLYYEVEKGFDLQFIFFELSDRLFMIEYLTLLQEGIEPLRLRDDN